MEAVQPDVRKPQNVEPLLITMEEFQHIIGSGKTTAFAILKRGDVEAVNIGRRRLPVLESVKKYVERLRAQALEAA